MKKQSKKVTKVRASKTAVKNDGARIPLKKICAEFGIEPKAARVKLRRIWRREESPGVSFHTKGSRWDLTPKEAREVREHLRPAS